jgi:hypothetical protein
MSDKKKAALSSFFAKNKSKRKGGALGGEGGENGEGARNGESGSGFSILGDSSASGWVEETPSTESASVDAVASAAVKAHLHMHIGEYQEEDGNDDEEETIRQKIEAEEAR